MKQCELIKELFNAEFISSLDVTEPDIDKIYKLVKSGDVIDYEAEITKVLAETSRAYFRAGVDNALTLLGQQPAFNGEWEKEQELKEWRAK